TQHRCGIHTSRWTVRRPVWSRKNGDGKDAITVGELSVADKTLKMQTTRGWGAPLVGAKAIPKFVICARGSQSLIGLIRGICRGAIRAVCCGIGVGRSSPIGISPRSAKIEVLFDSDLVNTVAIENRPV